MSEHCGTDQEGPTAQDTYEIGCKRYHFSRRLISKVDELLTGHLSSFEGDGTYGKALDGGGAMAAESTEDGMHVVCWASTGEIVGMLERYHQKRQLENLDSAEATSRMMTNWANELSSIAQAEAEAAGWVNANRAEVQKIIDDVLAEHSPKYARRGPANPRTVPFAVLTMARQALDLIGFVPEGHDVDLGAGWRLTPSTSEDPDGWEIVHADD